MVLLLAILAFDLHRNRFLFTHHGRVLRLFMFAAAMLTFIFSCAMFGKLDVLAALVVQFTTHSSSWVSLQYPQPLAARLLPRLL